MRFIVSPAKKMNVVDDAFAWRDLPAFLDRAEALARVMRERSLEEAKALWRCSDALAQLNHERFRTMDVRQSTLTPAVLAYDGIQYQHLAPRVMEAAHLDYLQEHLRILSGFYGMLRPLDGVVPYRLEMQAKLCMGDAKDVYAWWGDALYRSLAQEADTIVNLASVEYAKAVLPHVVEAGSPRVITCLFGTVENGKLVQRSTAAKAARGSMVRWCAENDIRRVEDLRAFDVAGYAYDPEQSTVTCNVFVCR